jgi:DNA-binding response OmpR family regulator
MPKSGSPTRVLLVENEQAIADSLARALTRAGFETTTVPTGAKAIACARRTPPDLVLIEGALPSGDSRAIYHRLRRDCGAAVVVLMDSVESADRDEALDGADDYVVKPVRDTEAIARIRAVLRRIRVQDSDATLVLGPLLLDPIAQRAALDGRDLRLSHMEYALLERLVRDAGTVLSRETLMHDVWHLADANGASKTLPAHIGLLRRKLGDDTANPRYIHTVRGVGFRFASAGELAQ